MKLTLNQIVTIDKELNNLLEKNLKVKLSYKISKFKLKTFELANLANSKRDDLTRKYGVPEGTMVRPPMATEDNWDIYVKEINELFSTEEELTDFSISIDELEDLELSPLFFINMGELITE